MQMHKTEKRVNCALAKSFFQIIVNNTYLKESGTLNSQIIQRNPTVNIKFDYTLRGILTLLNTD